MSRLFAHFIIHEKFRTIDAAIASLRTTNAIPVTLMITVNAGSSEDIAALRHRYPEAEIVVNDKPKGFAANHNAALKRTNGEYIALLNDDITFTAGVVDHLMAILEQNLDVGVLSPLIRLSNGQRHATAYNEIALLRAIYKISGLGRLTPQGGWVRRWLSHWGIAEKIGVESLKESNNTTRAVDTLVGVAMFTRRTVFEQVGGMDEDTWVFGEEYGWHLRMRRAGWRVLFVGDVEIIHHNEAQGIPTGWRLAQHRLGTLAYFSRYKPRWQTVLIRAAIIGCHGLWALLTLPLNRQESASHWGAVKIALTWRRDPQRDGARYAVL